MDYQTTEIINTENIKLGASQIFYRGRSASASGLILPSPVKKSLNKSKEGVLLHLSAVQFSTGGPVQFSPGIYKGKGDLKSFVLNLDERWEDEIEEKPVKVFDREGDGAGFFSGMVRKGNPFVTWEKRSDSKKLSVPHINTTT